MICSVLGMLIIIITPIHILKNPISRYKECEDGICRLQTVRFESVHLSQQLTEQALQDNNEIHFANLPGPSVEGSPCGEGEVQHVESVTRSEEQYQELLQQYEWHEQNIAEVRRPNDGGPVVSRRRIEESYPCERPASPELDLPQALLDLQDAAIRLANAK